MSEVSFYTGVADRLPFVCRLLRKAQQSGARIAVVGPEAALDRLDTALWTFEPTEFVPHLRIRADARPTPQSELTPVLLVDRAELAAHAELLLNLGPGIAPGYERFKRVLEVVSTDEQQVQAGRDRFKAYRAGGHAVTHHVVGA
jgi:DNA polymerase-3 subunit chi